MINWGLTRHEKLVLLFLMGFLFIGTSINVWRHQFNFYSAEKKQQIARLDSLKEQFIHDTDSLDQSDSTVVLTLVTQPGSKIIPLININEADVSELVKLPKIGPALARRIIQYRREKGKFKKKEEICRVKGIGEKTYQKIKPFITVN